VAKTPLPSLRAPAGGAANQRFHNVRLDCHAPYQSLAMTAQGKNNFKEGKYHAVSENRHN